MTSLRWLPPFFNLCGEVVVDPAVRGYARPPPVVVATLVAREVTHVSDRALIVSWSVWRAVYRRSRQEIVESEV